MALAPFAGDRQKLEEIIIRASRTKTPRDIDLARRSLSRFREKWPEAAGAVAAFSHVLDSLPYPPSKNGS